jgi:hypothetical protein
MPGATAASSAGASTASSTAASTGQKMAITAAAYAGFEKSGKATESDGRSCNVEWFNPYTGKCCKYWSSGTFNYDKDSKTCVLNVRIPASQYEEYKQTGIAYSTFNLQECDVSYYNPVYDYCCPTYSPFNSTTGMCHTDVPYARYNKMY